MSKKLEKKIIEFDLEESEFDKCVVDGGLALLESTDDYKLYGNQFGDDIKYKNYIKGGKDAFKVVQIVPQEVTCGKCHIKIHSAYYDNCPVCEASLEDMIQKNRKFNDIMHDFQMELNAEFQERHGKKQAEMVTEFGFDFE